MRCRDSVAVHLQDLTKVQLQLYGNIASIDYLLLQLTTTTFGSSGQRIIPLTDALTKVELIAFHSCW